MGFWTKLLGAEPSPAAASIAAEPTARERTHAEIHRDRFARAIEQAEKALKHGETCPERIAELKRWHDYYAGLAQLEAVIAPAAEEEAA
jgi:hypothetical protein